MTNETAPERIWVSNLPYDIGRIGDLEAMGFAWNMAHGHNPVAYIREDISEIRTERVRAELEAAQARIAVLEGALRGALTVIDDYLGYEHDGDPWTEDARQMGEMDINEYQRDGRLEAARAALEGKGCS